MCEHSSEQVIKPDEIEITPAMIEAGVKACLPLVGNDTFEDLLEEGLVKAYRAMYAARPQCQHGSEIASR